jgi:hypothetical protein
MNKILDAQDILILTEAREFSAPIVAVANAASQKIDEACELLAECALANRAPVSAAPDAKPKSPAARTNRRNP